MPLANIPRSVRDNNPGNIERTGIPWLGLAAPDYVTMHSVASYEIGGQSDPPARPKPLPRFRGDLGEGPRFCVFVSPELGFRALALDLHTKWEKDDLRTVSAIISRFAPPNENDTAAYIKAVSDAIGIAPDTALNLEDPAQLSRLCRAIAVQESGGWFFETADLDAGVALALGLKDTPLIA